MRRAAAQAVLAATIAASGLAPVGPPASALSGVTITWPTATKINPDTMTYEVTTTGINSDKYRFVAAGSGDPVATPVDPDGATVVALPDDDGTAGVRLEWCDVDRRVVELSPALEIRRRLVVPGWIPSTTGPLDSWELRIGPSEVAAVDASWEIYASPRAGNPPLVTGSVDDAPEPFAMPSFAEAGLVHGEEYELRIAFASDTAWGRLEAELSDNFTWDAAVDGSLELSPRTLYPVRDGHRDRILIKLRTHDDDLRFDWPAIFRIHSSAGDLIRTANVDASDGFASLSWTGRQSSGAPYPAGVYEASVEVTDAVGNTATFVESFDLSHQRLEFVDWRRSFRAADVLIDKDVGRCAALKRPARAAWPASLGYRSDRRCARPLQTIVSTVHGVYVPYSLKDRYQVRVSLVGCKAAGQETSYLRLFNLNRRDNWTRTGEFDGSLGTHVGSSVDGGYVRGQGEGSPHVIWSVGLGGGYKYDVKRFIVHVSYLTLTD